MLKESSTGYPHILNIGVGSNSLAKAARRAVFWQEFNRCEPVMDNQVHKSFPKPQCGAALRLAARVQESRGHSPEQFQPKSQAFYVDTN